MAEGNEPNTSCCSDPVFMKRAIRRIITKAKKIHQERVDANKRKLNLKKPDRNYDIHPHGEILSNNSNVAIRIMHTSTIRLFEDNRQNQQSCYEKSSIWWKWHTFKIALVDNEGQILLCRFTKVDENESQEQPWFMVRPLICNEDENCVIGIKASLTPSSVDHQLIASSRDLDGSTVPSECGQFVLGIPEESVTDCLVRFQGYYVGNPADLDSTTRKLPDVSMCLPGRYSIEIDMKRKEPSGFIAEDLGYRFRAFFKKLSDYGMDYMMDACYTEFCQCIDRMDNSSEFSDIKALIKLDAFCGRAYFKGEVADVEEVIQSVSQDIVLREALTNCNLVRAVWHRMLGAVKRQNGNLEEAWHHLQLNGQEMMYVASEEDQVRLTLERAMYYHERHMHDKIILERELEQGMNNSETSKKHSDIKSLGNLDPLKMSKNLYENAFCQARDYVMLRIMIQLRLRRAHIYLGTSRGTAPKPDMVRSIEQNKLSVAREDIEWIWSCIKKDGIPASYTLHCWFSIAESDWYFVNGDFPKAYAFAKYASKMAVALQLKIETKGSRTRLDQLERLDRTLQKNAYRLSDVELHQYLESQDNVQSRYETEFSTLMKDFKTKVENMVEQQSRRVIQHPTD